MNKVEKQAEQVCEELGKIAEIANDPKLVDRITNVKESLCAESDSFNEEFLGQNGLQKLLNLLQHPMPKINICALQAILESKLIAFVSAQDYLRTHPELFNDLYEKISEQVPLTRYLALMTLV